MSLVSSSFTLPSYVNHAKKCHSVSERSIPLNEGFSHCKIPWKSHSITKFMLRSIRNKKFTILKCTPKDDSVPDYASFGDENTINIDWGDQEGAIDDEGSPWEGAIIYRRKASVSHVEYCTTLERLGMGKFSTDTSKSRASIMGLRVTKTVKDYPLGTPVQVSIDVTRKKQKIRLDGIIKTVLTLGCNRCGEPAAKSVFSNFSLILTEEPIEEPDIINMGVMFGTTDISEDDDESTIDLDDWLYFPPEEKEIDISKQLRDLVHVEITMNAVCDSICKGMCLKCGVNLNTSSCNCNKEEVKEKGIGPLATLKKQMQQRGG